MDEKVTCSRNAAMNDPSLDLVFQASHSKTDFAEQGGTLPASEEIPLPCARLSSRMMARLCLECMVRVPFNLSGFTRGSAHETENRVRDACTGAHVARDLFRSCCQWPGSGRA